MSLKFKPHAAEAEGEVVYTAEARGLVFWVKKEPHVDHWEWIVCAADDGFPIDLGAKVESREVAEEACRKWLEEVETNG